MEEAAATTDDPFAGEQGDDPFAGGDNPRPQADQNAPLQEAHPAGDDVQPEPPIVDKEGARIDAPAEAPAAAVQEPDAAPEPPAPAAAAEEAAQPAQQAGDEKNPLRLYRLIYQTGEKSWEEAEWLEDDMGNPVDNSGIKQDGLKGNKTRILKARNADHARRMSWPILGAPDDGITVLPVPDSSWKPKRLKARAVPVRQALEIS